MIIKNQLGTDFYEQEVNNCSLGVKTCCVQSCSMYDQIEFQDNGVTSIRNGVLYQRINTSSVSLPWSSNSKRTVLYKGYEKAI